MKALTADFSLTREVWGRVKSRLVGPSNSNGAISLSLQEVPDPALLTPQWIRVRTITSGISDLDEGIIFNGNPSGFGTFVSFPFVPGNENMGIVIETGPEVNGVEIGDRVVVNPLLSCEPRGVEPLCPSCAQGDPASCRNFSRGMLSPGVVVGGCKDTMGGWADSFLCHMSQVRKVPPDMTGDAAALVPEFTRSLRGVLQNMPSPGERVIVVGGSSLGLLTMEAFKRLDVRADVLLIVENPFEADVAKQLGCTRIVIGVETGDVYEQVAEFLGSEVRYPEFGRIGMDGGADLVFETTGRRRGVEDALRFTGEGKRCVLMGLREPYGFDATPLWFKRLEVRTSLFSGLETHNGEISTTFDIAMDLTEQHGLPVEEIVTHRFSLADHRDAIASVMDRAEHKVVKAVFHHVV